MKKLIGFALAGFAVFALVAPLALTANAAEFISASDDSGNVTLSQGDTHHNAYVAGASVFVNSAVTGDLYAAGGTITVENTIEQDAVVAGGTVILNSSVGGDVRVAGGTLTINGPVAGDLIVAGGVVTVTEKATVGGDLIVAGGQITLDGSVAGKAMINGGAVIVNSAITGPLRVTASESLMFGAKANVAQKISHKGIKEATVNEAATVGEIEFTQMKSHNNKAGAAIAAIFTIGFVVKLLAAILAGLLLMKLLPLSSRRAVAKISDNPWANLGIGVLVLFVGPVAVIFTLITFVGMYLAIIAFLVWLLALVLASLSSGVFVGSWIVQKLTKKTEMAFDWQALAIGVVALAVIKFIPIIGWLFVFVVLLMAFGAMMRMLVGHIKHEQSHANHAAQTEVV
ncbi:hypothetical protein IPM19_01665 [bacterium]|nr:MAG: hypothetical protein IPM19_01665 [bacterium]